MAHSDQPDQCDDGAALLELFARGTELTRRLVDEADRLRRLVHEADRRPGDGADPGSGPFGVSPTKQLEALRGENHALLERLRSAEASSERWAARHAETERCHDDLANLFVASDQLHSTRDPDEVVSAISEIVINLVGAERFVLYAYDGERERLTPFVAEGFPLEGLAEVRVGEGEIGQAVARGEVWVGEAGLRDGGRGDGGAPIAVIPLCVRTSVLGAIAIHKLLEQKSGISELDRQLFDLLAQHASTALLLARMQQPFWHAQRKRLRPIDRVTN